MAAERRPAPPLSAREQGWLLALAEGGRLHDLVRLVGGPVHVLHPATMAATLDRWTEVARGHSIAAAIRFGKKANKSRALAAECARAASRGLDIGVDVSSAEELVAALAAGNRGERLVVTGPTQTEELLWLSARHGATVAVSTVGDLERVCRLFSGGGDRLDVLLRMRTGSSSRFGVDPDRLLNLVRTPPVNHPRVRIRGVSFHCSGHAVDDRVAATRRALPILDAARLAGHPADVLSAGGGWPVDHVASCDGLDAAQVWARHVDSLEPSHFLPGSLPGGFYPYGVERSGEKALDEYLRSGIARDLVKRGVTLLLEPGRALCTGAGASVFPVLSTEVRTDLGPDVGVTVVDGTSLSLSEQWFDSEFCPDPVLIGPDGAPAAGPVAFGAAVAGRTCLDSDLLSRRFVPLPRRPVEGDLLVYPDTAGYQMDSNESPFHGVAVPRKIVALDHPTPHFEEDSCSYARLW